MKKLFAILLAVTLVLCLAACGKTAETPKDTQPTKNDATQGTTPSQGGEQNATQPTQPAATNPTTPSAPSQGGETHSHSWDYSKATITKQPSPVQDGSQTVPCSGCKETFTETLTKLSASGAFSCAQLSEMVAGTESEGQNCMTAQTVVAFMLATKEGSFTQSSGDFFAEAGKYFALNDTLKSGIKAVSTAAFRYDAGADKFTYEAAPAVNPAPLVKGFVHNGGNKYTVYYYNSTCGCWVDDCMLCLKPFHFKVELELNRGYNNMEAANKILSVTKIKSAPDNITT